MSVPQQTVQAMGAAATATGGIASIVTAATPILQAVLLLASIVVAVLTSIYTWKRIRDKSKDQ